MPPAPSAGGDVGVLAGPDGVLFVDDQIPSLTERAIRGVRRIADEFLRFVVDTHVHIDHIGAAESVADRGAAGVPGSDTSTAF